MHDPDPSDPATPVCWFCGEPEVLEIAEVWTDSNFLLSTCCEGLLSSVSAGISDDPAWGRDLLRWLGAEELTGHRLRRVSDGEGCHPMLDWQLDLHPVGFAQARAFVACHHAHCPPPVAHRWCHAVWSGRQMVGVFYGVVLSTLSDERLQALAHESRTHGSYRTNRDGAASPVTFRDRWRSS